VEFVVEIVSVRITGAASRKSYRSGMNEAVGPLATTGVIEAERLASVVRPELPSWIFDDPVVPAVTVPVEGMESDSEVSGHDDSEYC